MHFVYTDSIDLFTCSLIRLNLICTVYIMYIIYLSTNIWLEKVLFSVISFVLMFNHLKIKEFDVKFNTVICS